MFHVMFNVDCNPVGKGRPRFRRQGNFVRTYSDKKTLEFEDLVRQAAIKAMGTSEPLETPVALFCYVRLPVPQSHSKKRTMACLEGLERPAKKPDLDNIVKAVSDAINTIIFKDDAQVVSLHATKKYDSNPGIEILVKEELP